MSISARKTDLVKTLSGIIRQCGQTTLFKKGMAVEIFFFKSKSLINRPLHSINNKKDLKLTGQSVHVFLSYSFTHLQIGVHLQSITYCVRRDLGLYRIVLH